ncbi:MAG: hypothetical protein V9F01_16550 [Chitinophagaceae bacterium]
MNKSKIALAGSLCLIIAIFLGNLTEKITSPSGYVEIRVRENKRDISLAPVKQRPSIDSFDAKTTIVGHPYLEISFNHRNWIEIFAPDLVFFDPIVALCVISICLVFLLRLKKIDPDKPFSIQVLAAVKWATIITFTFAGIDYLRLYLLDEYVMKVTNNIYRLPIFSIPSSGLFLLGICLLLLFRILQRAELIQQEQELTV